MHVGKESADDSIFRLAQYLESERKRKQRNEKKTRKTTKTTHENKEWTKIRRNIKSRKEWKINQEMKWATKGSSLREISEFNVSEFWFSFDFPFYFALFIPFSVENRKRSAHEKCENRTEKRFNGDHIEVSKCFHMNARGVYRQSEKKKQFYVNTERHEKTK